MTIPQPVQPITPPPAPTSLPQQPLVAPLDPVIQKKSPIIAILLTLLVLATGAAAYFYSQSRTTSPAPIASTSPTPTATTDPTADWKTYNLDNYGVSLKYPGNWKLTESPTPDRDDWKSGNIFQLISSGANISHGDISGGSYITFNVIKPDQNYANLDDYLIYSTAQYSNTYTSKIINNIVGHTFTTTNTNSKGEGGFVFEKNNLIFVINWIYSDNPNDINQILQTFQFTDQSTSTIDTSDWQTYTETREVKFSIKYPPTWTVNTQDGMFGEKKASFNSGKEAVGLVNIVWNSEPVEPDCNHPTQTKEWIQISSRTIEMCHYPGSTQEPEGYFYNSSTDGVNFSIVATPHLGEENRKMILKVLSTLEL